MGRKGSMNLQVITDSFVKDQSRRRNCQALSARIPTTPLKTQQRKLSSPEIELTSSPNKKPVNPVLSIQTVPKSAIPKGSAPRSGFPTSALPKSAFPSLRISTLIAAGNKAVGPKTPLSASGKKKNSLSVQTPTSTIPDIDAPDTPVNVIYANAFFDNKTREDEETEAISKKVLKQQRKENIRNMRRERMKQPKDIRVALILGRLYDACNYELGPLSYWSDPEVENNEELKPKEVEEVEETKSKPMVQFNPNDDENESEIEDEKKSIQINYDKINNVNAHPAWVPEEAGCSNIACKKTATRVNGKLVKKNKKPYVAIASYFAKLYDPILMKKMKEEEKLKSIEKQRENSIITEIKPMGKSLNSRNNNNYRQNNNGYNSNNNNNNNNYRNQGGQNHYQNRHNYNKTFNNSINNNNTINQQPNNRSNFYNNKRSPTQTNNYMNSNDYSQTYSYGYVYQYPIYQYYDPSMVPNYNVGYGNSYANNNYYYNSSYNNNVQNKFKPRMNNYNKSQNTFNNKKTNEAYTVRNYENNKVNIKS